MYWTGTYYKLFDKACIWSILLGCIIRVSTNYLYGVHYNHPDEESWRAVYYGGQAWFELLILIGATGIVKRHLAYHYYIVTAYFTDLAILSWVKEYLSDPTEWQYGEAACFIISFFILIIRISVNKKTKGAIINFLKLVFR